MTHKEDFITKFNTKISEQTTQSGFLQMKSMLLISLNSINKITILPLHYHSPRQLQLLQQTPSQLNPSPIFLLRGGGYEPVLVTLIMNNRPRVTLQWSFLLQESEVFLPELLGFLTQRAFAPSTPAFSIGSLLWTTPEPWLFPTGFSMQFQTYSNISIALQILIMQARCSSSPGRMHSCF